MDRLIELGELCGYYGALLTERQRSLVQQYAYENLTLAEIAEREGISRQGVRDGIVHAEQQLLVLERSLRLVEKTRRTRAILKNLSQLARWWGLPDEAQAEIASQIDALNQLWEDEEEDGV